MNDTDQPEGSPCIILAQEILKHLFSGELLRVSPPYRFAEAEKLSSLELALKCLNYSPEDITLTEAKVVSNLTHWMVAKQKEGDFEIRIKMSSFSGEWKIRELVYTPEHPEENLIPRTHILF